MQSPSLLAPPAAEVDFLSGQTRQEALPSSGWYEPAGHGAHSNVITLKKVPAGHSTEMKENGSTEFVPRDKILNVEARSTACFQIEGEAGGKGVTACHAIHRQTALTG